MPLQLGQNRTEPVALKVKQRLPDRRLLERGLLELSGLIGLLR